MRPLLHVDWRTGANWRILLAELKNWSKQMLQELTIRTNDRATLEPVLKAAIDNEKKMLSLGLDRTRQRLAEYERQYGITSGELERGLHSMEMTESVAFSEWRMEIGMLHLLEGQYRALQEAELA
jgi:hypothetical protein